MKKTEKVSVKLYEGGYERRPDADKFGLSDTKFEIKYDSHTYQIEDVGPADVFLTSTTLIAAGAGVISAAITGAFAYLANRKGGHITITGKNGASIEVPEGTSKEEIDYYIAKAKEIDADSLLVSGSPENRKGKKKGRI
ncbi:hypothetical protein [Marinobacter sp.]|uniref:hypothetical protein n=1 Tax=Marinobacter sp. TaxID=50741 RepID=UPI000C4BA10C|nr:hypothetical protein [Marinobacter sp.]MBE95675.1 hypothetical protein [Marinobacter sp.]|tara:strand:+ start:884 stop:1300 length:417 start_codon:yes stop_codon:yes gene_type:complete